MSARAIQVQIPQSKPENTLALDVSERDRKKAYEQMVKRVKEYYTQYNVVAARFFRNKESSIQF